MGDWADNAVSGFARSGMWGRANRKRPTQIVTCHFCGKGDLRWGQKKGGLWEVRARDGSSHQCPEMVQDKMERPNGD